MKEFLERIKLIDYLTTELKISKLDFVDRLYRITDAGGAGPFSEVFDAFTSSNNQYKGQITLQGFKIKRRRTFFDSISSAVASGSFQELDGSLKIETKINGFSNVFIPVYILILSFYIVMFFALTNSAGGDKSFVIFLLIFQLILMLIIPFFMMRASVKRLKYELEREFFYLKKE